jgi:hypothetical protein
MLVLLMVGIESYELGWISLALRIYTRFNETGAN